MNIRIFSLAPAAIIATVLGLWANGAAADPHAEGYDAYPLATIGLPRAIAADSGKLFVLTVHGVLHEVDRTGDTTEIVDFGRRTWVGLAPDPASDSIYASNNTYGYVAEYSESSGGPPLPIVGGIPRAAGLAVSEDGERIYAASYTGNQIHTYDVPAGEHETCGTSDLPDGLALWDGTLYIANRREKRIEYIDDLVACETPQVCVGGIFSDPVGIGRGDDELFVADFGSGSIFRIDSDCIATELATGFKGPVGVAQIGENLFVAENRGNTIWLLTPNTVSGAVSGIAPPITVSCENLSNPSVVQFELGIGQCDYNCTSEGLDADPDDIVRVDIDASVPDPSARPVLEFIHVPALGSFDNLFGFTSVEDPTRYAIATYIKVSGGWWTKPYWAYPTVPIDEDGYFFVDITTGGHDQNATEIVAYLVPEGYSPPSLGNSPMLPLTLERMDGDCDDFAVAKASAVRVP